MRNVQTAEEDEERPDGVRDGADVVSGERDGPAGELYRDACGPGRGAGTGRGRPVKNVVRRRQTSLRRTLYLRP